MFRDCNLTLWEMDDFGNSRFPGIFILMETSIHFILKYKS